MQSAAIKYNWYYVFSEYCQSSGPKSLSLMNSSRPYFFDWAIPAHRKHTGFTAGQVGWLECFGDDFHSGVTQIVGYLLL